MPNETGTGVRIRLWLSTLNPRPKVRVVRHWIWVLADPRVHRQLASAGFKSSRVAPRWHYHAGLRWRDGENPARSDVNRRLIPGRRASVGQLGFGWAEAMNQHARGFRARLRSADHELLVVDWLVPDRRLAGVLSEMLLVRLERWQADAFTLKGWRVPPPLAPDLVARRQADLSDRTLTDTVRARLIALRASWRRPHRQLRRQALARQIADVVHDPALTLEQKAGAELGWLRACSAEDLWVRKRMLLGLLVCPEGYVPPGMPASVAAVEAATGPTPDL